MHQEGVIMDGVEVVFMKWNIYGSVTCNLALEFPPSLDAVIASGYLDLQQLYGGAVLPHRKV